MKKYILLTFMIFNFSTNTIFAKVINRTFTNEKLGDIYTIQFNTDNMKTGIVKRASGSKKAENCIGKKVDLTCITKGAIGMPNPTLKNYMGMIKLEDHDKYDRCYVYMNLEDQPKKTGNNNKIKNNQI